jgi:RecA/RadA recombinase
MPEDLSKLIEEIEDSLDSAVTIANMSKVITPYHEKLSTGLLSLDIKLNGGYPRGTIVQLHGADGSGKDLLVNMAFAAAQKRYGDSTNLVWSSFGYLPDLEFMRLCGCKLPLTDAELTNKGILAAIATKEQRGESLGNILLADLARVDAAHERPAEHLFQTALNLIESGKFHIVVVNELGSGETGWNRKVELHDEKENRMATWSTLVADFLRKYYTAIRRPLEIGGPNKTTTFMINPQRALIGGMPRGPKTTMTSGFALKHAKALDLHIRSGRIKKRGDKRIAKEIHWRIAKGKHGVSEGAEGTFLFYFNKGVDLVDDLATAAKSTGHIKVKGRYGYVLDYEEKINGGIKGVIEELRGDAELQDEVRTAVLTSLKTKEIGVDDD